MNHAAPIFRLDGRRIWVAGHRGMVGSALMRRLSTLPCTLLTADRHQADLRRQAETEAWMSANRPDVVIVAAATVGGILANMTRPAEFLYDNLMIAANVVEAARRVGVAKLLYLGSTCIYPKLAPQPMAEDSLLTGALEDTNQWYALAKIAGIKLCDSYRRSHGCDFISAMPTNLYGPNDNFDPTGSHVLPALIRRAHEAKEQGLPSLTVWGTGRPLREFLHVDDLADALLFLLGHYADEGHVNVGSGREVSIVDLVKIVCNVVGYKGTLTFDASKPDGTPRKLVDCRKLEALGWRPRIGLDEGIAETYRWVLANRATARGMTRA
ncbi:MAG: GDP-L-fucose synthase [Alphaproteobacteria bacterium]